MQNSDRNPIELILSHCGLLQTYFQDSMHPIRRNTNLNPYQYERLI